ncbi:MAG: hypothetical protein HF973_08090 [Chloroflexi bacterium]|nr:hypothetical protein [Chloroflexota bacterium]
MKRKITLLLTGITIWLAACGQAEPAAPTLMPVAQLPTATATSLPPTLDIEATRSRTAVTPTPEETTSSPGSSITPTPVTPTINITTPKVNELIFVGNELTVAGLTEREPEQTVLVSLVTANGRLLAQQPGETADFGWQTRFVVPQNVTGAAKVQAMLLDAGGNILATHEAPVLLQLGNTEGMDRYLDLYRPEINDTAVSGFNIVFDGEVLRPAGNLVTISIWVDDCQNKAAQEGFRLGSSSKPFKWQGFVVVPKDLSGPACAVASFGEPGTENWREAQIPIGILPPDSLEARGVTIAYPPPDSEITAGEEILLYGVAQNVATGPVNVSMLMENGRIVGGGATETDYWGYWELPLILPFDIEGLAEITVAAGEGDTTGETTIQVRVLPAPTPTP